MKKLLCYVGLHDWTRWGEWFYYEQGRIRCRGCNRCGKVGHDVRLK